MLCGLPLESRRGGISDRANQRAAAVSHLSVKNKSDERTRRDTQLGVTAARSAAVTTKISGAGYRIRWIVLLYAAFFHMKVDIRA